MTRPMPPDAEEFQDDPDIVRYILDRVDPLVSAEQRQQLTEVETQARNKFGGMRLRIPKRKKYMTDQQRRDIAEKAIKDTTSTNEQLITEAGISRRHWYEIIKKRGG